MKPFTERTIEIIRAIPPGKVMTYGQIARLAGSPRAARQVVRILHSMSGKYSLPWHRVVNARGEIAIQDEETRFQQIILLESEGIEVAGNKVNLESNGHQPEPIDGFWEP
ncbi:MGMT family protein [Bacillus sp. FJAT-27245]|uniref:MGMT family protein n=1 Tax=Bacillus sp. FJAT-27245 TaxID=1684144 RepID=UPI0006A79C5C|nr:MGMT family protein [Bacillus sp. FJAT-27245]